MENSSKLQCRQLRNYCSMSSNQHDFSPSSMPCGLERVAATETTQMLAMHLCRQKYMEPGKSILCHEFAINVRCCTWRPGERFESKPLKWLSQPVRYRPNLGKSCCGSLHMADDGSRLVDACSLEHRLIVCPAPSKLPYADGPLTPPPTHTFST